MNPQKLITVFLLMLPGLSLAAVSVTAPEPGIFPLLAVGGIATFAVQYMRRKR